MDKRTLIAVVLSVVVISVGFMLQGVLSRSHENETTSQQSVSGTNGTAQSSNQAAPQGQLTTESSSKQPGQTPVKTPARTTVIPAEQTGLRQQTYTINTDVLIVTLTTNDGDITAIRLKKHKEGDELVDMIFRPPTGPDAFFVNFGAAGTTPKDVLFKAHQVDPYTIQFSREFLAPPGSDGKSEPFTLVKTYKFSPKGYMFELSVTITNSVNQYPNLNFDGYAYTLGFGPQIGPIFTSLGGRGDYRNYVTYEDGKVKTHKIGGSGEAVINNQFAWAGIAGKYFALLAVPDATPYELTFASPTVQGIPSSSFMYFSRPPIKSSKSTDVFRFYAGPKIKSDLGIYNTADKNYWHLSDMNLDSAVHTSVILGWLQNILKFFLNLFYRLIPNYGVAIILLTILIKVLFYPLTKKSFESTAKMQALNPKITELREKYKNNPTRMNQEMAALYKREKVNPLGGCLPLLLQMPIFIALYGLLSTYFPLRGAPFVLWINDLSAPDSILSFAPFKLPILGWSDIRVLPILYVGSQLISSRLMQTPNSNTTKNMRLMTYLMPVFFFFILYNAPSGLLLYWTMTNILTAVQQRAVRAYQETHPDEIKAKAKKKSTFADRMNKEMKKYRKT